MRIKENLNVLLIDLFVFSFNDCVCVSLFYGFRERIEIILDIWIAATSVNESKGLVFGHTHVQ